MVKKIPGIKQSFGEVVKIVGNRKFGFIRRNKQETKGKDIFFHLDSVHNKSKEEITLQRGSKIWFELNPKCPEEKPEARIVYVNSTSKSMSQVHIPQAVSRKGRQWMTGTVIKQQEKFYFIRPHEPLPDAYVQKDVYLESKLISKHVLRLAVGDQVEFLLGARNKKKPSARSAAVLHYKQRSTDDLVIFMKNLSTTIKENSMVLTEVLSCKSLWQMLSNHAESESDEDLKFLSCFLTLTKQVLTGSALFRQLSKEICETLIKSHLFFTRWGNHENTKGQLTKN